MTQTRPTRDTWLCRAARFSWFTVPSANSDTGTWFQDVVGFPPDQSTKSPRTAVQEDIGPDPLGIVVLHRDPLRIDWLVSSESPDGTSNVSLVAAHSRLGEIVRRWVDVPGLPVSTRLAVGYSLQYPAKDREGAYALLKQLLPAFSTIDGRASSDFIYQINRRRKSSINPMLEINRLSRWHATLAVQTQFRATPTGPIPSETQAQHFASVDLDINTQPEFSGTFAPSQAPAFFDELTSMAVEIAQSGDIA